MSKIWLLLLLVAAVQFAHSYPAEYEIDDEYQSDEEGNTWDIIKDAWNKLASRYKKLSKENLIKAATLLHNKLCAGQEDYEEDVQGTRNKIIQTIKELYKTATEKAKEKKEQLEEALAKTRAKLCAQLSKAIQENDVDEDEGDEERGKASKIFDKLGQKMKQGLKKLKEKMKKAMKKGAEMLKNMGVKVNPLQCEEKTCKSCIIFKIPTEKAFCIQMRFMRTNKATYLIVGFGKEEKPQFEQQIKLGDLPRCLNVGGFVGNVCLKGLEGRAKSSKGQANINFCLAILAENFGVGCKFCATYENKKVKVKFVPETFAGAIDDDGDIVVLDKNGEDGVALGTDELEID